MEHPSPTHQALQTIGRFSDRDLLLFGNAVQLRQLAKEEIILKQGEVCRSVFYLVTGAVYQYSYNDDMELNVIDLHVDQEWFLNQQSFVAQKPSGSFIRAYAESQVLELSVHALHELIAASPAFLQMGRVLDQTTEKVHFFDQALSPAEKYQYIFENRPQLLQKFPLKLIASYLKITPETLSRVREKLSRGGKRS